MWTLRKITSTAFANFRQNSTKSIGILGVPFDKGKIKDF